VARTARNSSRLDLILLGLSAFFSIILLVLPVSVREPMAGSMRRGILAPLIILQERAELTRRAFVGHAEATAARDTLAMKALSVPQLETENIHLRELLKLGARLRTSFVPAEALRDSRDESAVILTAGSNAGVKRSSPVVSPDGVVGIVESVDPTMSSAILWSHPDFRVSAMAADTAAKVVGMVQPYLGGGNSHLLQLTGVPFRASLKPGTLIVTAGLGGVFPPHIPIGRVVEELRSQETWARTYLINPAVSAKQVTSVMILSPDRVVAAVSDSARSGMQTVWEIGEEIEASVRGIREAGDSLTRQEDLADSAAARKKRDSLNALNPPMTGDTSAGARARASDSAARARLRRDSLNRANARRRTRRDSVTLGPRPGSKAVRYGTGGTSQ
jgi:cell shape-determining protein MreC